MEIDKFREVHTKFLESDKKYKDYFGQFLIIISIPG